MSVGFWYLVVWNINRRVTAMRSTTETREKSLLQELAVCAFADHGRAAELSESLLGDRRIAETPSLCFATAMARMAAIQSGATDLNWGTMRTWKDGERISVAVMEGRRPAEIPK
jgi:hypothetical protein